MLTFARRRQANNSNSLSATRVVRSAVLRFSAVRRASPLDEEALVHDVASRANDVEAAWRLVGESGDAPASVVLVDAAQGQFEVALGDAARAALAR